jgi:hypothetical protein
MSANNNYVIWGSKKTGSSFGRVSTVRVCNLGIARRNEKSSSLSRTGPPIKIPKVAASDRASLKQGVWRRL